MKRHIFSPPQALSTLPLITEGRFVLCCLRQGFFTFLLFFLLITGSRAALFSAENPGGLLRNEIEMIRTALARRDASAEEKHANYARLGRLLQLCGDTEGAAAAWQEAAYAVNGKRDDRALLESAACFMAMGEWEKADAGIKMVLLTVRARNDVFLKARYLAALIETFRNANESILFSLAGDPDYHAERPAILLTLWKLSGKDEYRARLLAEYPESPESCAVHAEKSGKNAVTDASSSQWFLYPGRENIIIDP
ncbi:MAG: hypothetical protein LBT01_01480 [Spirochaetaceae bacterium]|nr:hypothetical protein [Spirochaetaceae bacterium]